MAIQAVAEIHPSGDRLPNTEGLDRILVRTGRRIAVVRVSEIDWIEASGDYVSLHVKNDVWLVRETRGSLRGVMRLLAFAGSTVRRLSMWTESSSCVPSTTANTRLCCGMGGS